MELITSRRNPLVARLRALHQPRGRREQGLLLVEGTHLLQELLRLGQRPESLLATPAWIRRHGDLLAGCPGPVQPVEERVLEAVATTAHPDGVVATLPQDRLPRSVGTASFVLVLDELQDPGNLGTLCRTALAAGVEELWLCGGADPLQPKVLRASTGAALALPIWRGSRPDLIGRLQALAARGGQLVASVPPQPGAWPYWDLDWTRPTGLLLGNEGAGLAPDLLALADRRVTVPHSGAVESLNVAVAAAPLLLERQRQERMPLN